MHSHPKKDDEERRNLSFSPFCCPCRIPEMGSSVLVRLLRKGFSDVSRDSSGSLAWSLRVSCWKPLVCLDSQKSQRRWNMQRFLTKVLVHHVASLQGQVGVQDLRISSCLLLGVEPKKLSRSLSDVMILSLTANGRGLYNSQYCGLRFSIKHGMGCHYLGPQQPILSYLDIQMRYRLNSLKGDIQGNL